MRLAAAIFFGLSIIAAQLAHGGILEPFLPYPAYALACLGLLCALPSMWAARRQPWGWVAVAVIAFSGYSLWRCTHGSGEHDLSMRDAALVLACTALWAGSALALTRNDARTVFLCMLLAVGCGQTVIVVMQLVRGAGFSQPYWLSEALKGFYEFRFPLRPRGLFMNPNHLSWFMNALMLMMLSLGLWGRLGAIRRIGALYLAVMFGVVTVISASRGGMVSLAVGLAVFLMLSLAAILFSAQRRVVLLLVGTILLVFCSAGIYAAFSTSWVAQGRMEFLNNPEVRQEYYEQAVRLFQTDPLLGAGPGEFKYAARLYRTGAESRDAIFAHNDWIQYAAEYGFAGLSVLVVAVVLSAAAGIRGFLVLVRKASTETGSALSTSGAFVCGSLCALAATVAHETVDFNMHVPANALMASVLLGLAAGARPLELGLPRFRPVAWLTGATGLAAAVALAMILAARGEGEYHALQAENHFLRSEMDLAAAEADKGLALLPEDAFLVYLRARAYVEYETWFVLKGPGATPDAEDDGDEEDGDETESADAVVPEPVELPPEESAKNLRNALRIYGELLKVQPEDRKNYTAFAQALDIAGEQGQARRRFIEAIALDPELATPWANYGDHLVGLEQPQAARRIFEIGGGLAGGEYARGQVEAIDDEARFDEEAAQGGDDQQDEESEPDAGESQEEGETQ